MHIGSRPGPDLVTLRLFKSIVEESSLTRAAEREHMAVSAVSRRIADLESRLGVALLHRHGRGVQPTVAGQVLAQRANIVFEVLDRTFDELATLNSPGRSAIHVHAHASAITGFLPPVLASFTQQNPDVELVIGEGGNADILRAIQAGAIDIGILAGQMQDVGVDLMAGRRDRLVAVLPVGHRLAGSSHGLRLADLVHEHFIGLAADIAIQERLRQQARALGVALRERASVGSLDGVIRLVQAGLGIAVLPRASLGHQSERVDMCALVESWADRSISICVRDAGSLPAAVKSLVDHLIADQESGGQTQGRGATLPAASAPVLPASSDLRAIEFHLG